MGDPVTPIPKGDLRLLRREALTMPITNETSASAVHDILQELHDDSTESINEHQSPPPSSARDVKKPTPRKGTFGMASPDRQRTTPSPPTPTPRLFSSAVRSIRDDADYEKGASATRVPPVRPAGTLSGLYGHHEDDEDEQYEVKEEITQQSREPGSKRKIRFEEQSSRDEGEQKKQEAILEELVGNESQQQAAKESAKDSGGQEVTGRSTPKVKQGFRLRFGGKRQQVDTQEHQQLDEAADDSDPPNKADQQPQEAADGVGKSGQDIDGEKALDQKVCFSYRSECLRGSRGFLSQGWKKIGENYQKRTWKKNPRAKKI
ncbi:uncharacterized protein LOC111248733 [Varroa destructor]|uniref:Uncharacterized protein n=1 Tax=Varroa destructor TaxID=109461 RepID=A0A7M7JUI4_VARDE|nr:uncharacterized protein LOC111248733 [Varroa destructor]